MITFKHFLREATTAEKSEKPIFPTLEKLKKIPANSVDYEGMFKLMRSLPELTAEGVNKNVFKFDRQKAGYPLRKLKTALNKITVHTVWDTRGQMLVDWNWNKPTKATVLFDTMAWNGVNSERNMDISTMVDDDNEAASEIKKKLQARIEKKGPKPVSNFPEVIAYNKEMWKKAADMTDKRKNGTSFFRSEANLFAEIAEGPFKGSIVGVDNNKVREVIKKGETILIDVDPTYPHRTRLVTPK